MAQTTKATNNKKVCEQTKMKKMEIYKIYCCSNSTAHRRMMWKYFLTLIRSECKEKEEEEDMKLSLKQTRRLSLQKESKVRFEKWRKALPKIFINYHFIALYTFFFSSSLSILRLTAFPFSFLPCVCIIKMKQMRKYGKKYFFFRKNGKRNTHKKYRPKSREKILHNFKYDIEISECEKKLRTHTYTLKLT